MHIYEISPMAILLKTSLDSPPVEHVIRTLKIKLFHKYINSPFIN